MDGVDGGASTDEKTSALACLWSAIAAHPALIMLSCRLKAPLTSKHERDRCVEWMQRPLLEAIFTGHSGRAGMPTLLPLPYGPVSHRKDMQRRFTEHANAREQFSPLDAAMSPAAGHAPAPPLHPMLRTSLELSAGLRELHLNAVIDKHAAAMLIAGLHAHATQHGAPLTLLDLRFSRIGAAGSDALRSTRTSLSSRMTSCSRPTLPGAPHATQPPTPARA